MSLRIIYGRSGSGKTYCCLNEIKAAIELGAKKPLVLLVPEQFSFQAERDLVSVLKTGGILKTEVLSFQRMAFRIFSETGGITYPHIHAAGKCMILYRILDQLHGHFKIFSRSADRKGFVDTISTLITEFKRYGVTTGHLDKAVLELSGDDPLKEKLSELNMIYGEFEKALAQAYRDSDDDLTLAAQKLEASTIYDGAEIWIDGFMNFTPQEYKMIGQLLKKTERVNISLCTDSLEDSRLTLETDVFSPVKQAYRKLAGMARGLGVTEENPVFLHHSPEPRFKDSPELAHLEQNYYSYPYSVFQKETRELSLFSATNIFSEVESAAIDIIRLCRDKNLRYRDIGVISRNLPAYEKIIEAVFSEYGIPCFIDRKTDIKNHPLVRLALSMMDIFNENWSYESVFRYLKTGLTGVGQDAIDRLENYVLACGIRGNQWTKNEDWRMTPELMPDENTLESQKDLLEDINEIRARVWAPLAAFRKKVQGKRTAADFCTGLYDFLCALDVPHTIEKNIESFKAEGQLALANEYSQVWNILMEVFDQTVEVMGEETFSLERFSKIIEVGLGQYKIGIIPAGLDQVLIGSAERSKSHDIKAMYILGVNDGVFPSAAIMEGILTDQDRAALNHLGLELASDTRTQAFNEQYLVYRTLTAASRFLRVSWPIGDNEGKTLRPSSVISRLYKLFPAISVSSDILPARTAAQELKLLAAKKPAFNQMISALRQKADGKPFNPVWQEVYRSFLLHGEWKEQCKAAKKAFLYKNLAGSIESEKIRQLYGDPAVTSVSRLEKYTACPFAFYVQYGLRARERKIYRLSPPDIGTFLHAMIERFSRIVSTGDKTWRNFDREWCDAKVCEIVDEMLAKMQGTGIAASKRYTVLARRLKRVVARAVWLIAEQMRRSSFDPLAYEVGFGEGEKYPPITVELDSGAKVHLTGRIDRVDAFKTEEGTYLCIIDYKSGTKDFRLSDVYYGLQIQLMTYMDAVWEGGGKLSDSPVYPAGMLYFKIDDPIVSSSSKLSEQEVEAAIMKQLKMKGLLLADVKLIKHMDNTISGASQIIPASVNKGDVLGKNTSGATIDQFVLLRRYVKRLLKNLCGEIMKGSVDIRPYKKKNITSCLYCSFSSICQFDASMPENSYRLLYDRNNDEIWNLMNE
ncbi:MAG TPA: helicase-exonuclease AddAB subunit AddB [Ruminiclostridium sp.]|nr:helicase-exonuclease AddAB subunit AddB [Ruminiclostridium sp.]